MVTLCFQPRRFVSVAAGGRGRFGVFCSVRNNAYPDPSIRQFCSRTRGGRLAPSPARNLNNGPLFVAETGKE